MRKPEGHGFYERKGKYGNNSQAVHNAAEISQVILDLEGGRYALMMFSELVQELLEEENIPGAALVARKLHEAAEVPLELDALDERNTIAWIAPFSEVLGGILEEGIF